MIGCIPDLYYSEITSSTLICKLLPDLVGFRLLCCEILLQIFHWIAICLSSWKVSLKWRLNSLHYAEVWGREDLLGVFFRHHFQHNSKLWGTKCTVHLSLFMCSNILPLLLSSCTASGKINYHLIHTVNVHLPTNLTQFHLSAEASAWQIFLSQAIMIECFLLLILNPGFSLVIVMFWNRAAQLLLNDRLF